MTNRTDKPARSGLIGGMQKLTGFKGPVNPEATRPQPVNEPASQKRRNRKGTGLLTHHDPAVLKQLRVLAAEENTTQQALIAEAINLLFQSRQKDPIA